MKILIIGLGHIGASLAAGLASASKSKKYQVYGWDQNLKAVSFCKRKKWIKSLPTRVDLPNFDLCVICVQEDFFLMSDFEKSKLCMILSFLSSDTLITDVFSSKGEGFNNLRKFCKRNDLNLVFSHPLAGRENCGYQSADKSIWNGATVLIEKSKSFKKLSGFWKSLSMTPLAVTQSQHQKQMAYGSHLMHVLAYSLSPFLLKTTVSPSILGMTRVALSNPKTWTPILRSNRDALNQSIHDLEKALQSMRKILKNSNAQTLLGVLEKSHRIRLQKQKL